MILSFSTKINNKPTYFPQKIWCGLIDLEIVKPKLYKEFNKDILAVDLHFQPKMHTIRKDEKNRWKVGTMIDFYINTRTKDMFCFAPRIPVVSIQFIGIDPKTKDVNIDGKFLLPSEIETLAINDGFADYYEFFEYFDKEFHGKIIHWTNKRY